MSTGSGLWDNLWKDSKLPGWDSLSQEIFSALVKESGDPCGKTWLEAGAGSGRISARLAKQGAKVYMIDYSDAAIEVERETFRQEQVAGDFRLGDIRHMPYPDGFFDVTWTSGVVEHYGFEDQVSMLAELIRVTKPGGLVINLVPYANSPLYRLESGGPSGQGLGATAARRR